MLRVDRVGVLGKIAADLDRAVARRVASGAVGDQSALLLARGPGWSVSDVICTSGPSDRAFEEAHVNVSVGMVVGGTFQYRSSRGRHVMTPGSFLLGNHGECFECGHDHGAGDRCVAFKYAPEFFDRLIADAGVRPNAARFRSSRLPPTQISAPLVARASAAIYGMSNVSWEELALDVAIVALRFGDDGGCVLETESRKDIARVSASVRAIETNPGVRVTLNQLAADAGQSPFKYLRTFRRITGVTPHQFILRMRLRDAASRLLAHDANIIDVALESGFGDLSNFNRAFRLEFGTTPSAYRRRFGRGG